MDTLEADYLKGVTAQMKAYGERVQFALSGPGQRPNYQVTNTFDKKMAFDGNHHLLRAEEHEFAVGNATVVLTLQQIEQTIAGIGMAKTTSSVRKTRVVGSAAKAAVKPGDLIDIQKYEYFKNNMQKLPEGIRAYSQQVSALMKQGMSAEAAFGEIVQQYF
ncbi:hypothetical protein ACIQW9_03315 [Herminiimonas sp. NPDC097707]|uniref:hypothetical protein n=1 Tax=Herminiimonas sp. NPDC097707 TaxID=3364007 RepID=UPI00383A69CE